MKEHFEKLEGCQSTKVTCSDGVEMILFHKGDLTPEEIAIIQQYTGDEIRKALEIFGFKAVPVGHA